MRHGEKYNKKGGFFVNKPEIVVLDGYTLNPGDLSWDAVSSLGNLTVYDRTPGDKIAERIGNAQIILTNKTPLTKQVIEQCPNIRYIGVLATGYNVVDVKAAQEKGITVTNIPTYGTSAVAQYAIALLLEICHHIGAHSQSVKSGQWTASEDFCYWNYPLIELAGKTMGIIGFGRIGRAVAEIAKALGMNVIYHDSQIFNCEYKYYELDTLFAKAHVISLHCPLFENTKGIINKNSISKMKNGVIIINTSRGPLINESDLAEALKAKKVYYAAVDVVSTEPIAADNPLLEAENCIITPHIAWAPKESRQRLMDIAADNINQFLAGNPVNTVT